MRLFREGPSVFLAGGRAAAGDLGKRLGRRSKTAAAATPALGSDDGTHSTTPCARSPATPVAISTYPQRSKLQFATTTAVSKPRQTSLEMKRAAPQVPQASSQTTSVSPPARQATFM